MSMCAIFELPCCDREMVFGRYHGDEMYPPQFTCESHGRVRMRFLRYVDEQLNQIRSIHAWPIPLDWKYDEASHRYLKNQPVPQGTTEVSTR